MKDADAAITILAELHFNFPEMFWLHSHLSALFNCYCWTLLPYSQCFMHENRDLRKIKDDLNLLKAF